MSYNALVIPVVGECREVVVRDVAEVNVLIEGHLEMLPLAAAPTAARHFAWVNEDGLRLGLDPNPRVSVLAGRMIVGTAVCWAHNGTPGEGDVERVFVDYVNAMVHL